MYMYFQTKAPKDHRIHCYSGSWKTTENMMEHVYIGVTGKQKFVSQHGRDSNQFLS